MLERRQTNPQSYKIIKKWLGVLMQMKVNDLDPDFGEEGVACNIC